MMLQGGGYEIIDLGVDIKPERFAEEAQFRAADIVALSALLTATMPAMKDTVVALRSSGIRNQVVVIVGGASVTQRFAEEIGADGYSADAVSAVAVVGELIAMRRDLEDRSVAAESTFQNGSAIWRERQDASAGCSVSLPYPHHSERGVNNPLHAKIIYSLAQYRKAIRPGPATPFSKSDQDPIARAAWQLP